jgi:hypothetical protein
MRRRPSTSSARCRNRERSGPRPVKGRSDRDRWKHRGRCAREWPWDPWQGDDMRRMLWFYFLASPRRAAADGRGDVRPSLCDARQGNAPHGQCGYCFLSVGPSG